MKTSILVAGAFLISSPTWAARVMIQDPCSSTFWLNTVNHTSLKQTVGDFTVASLQAHSIAFRGDAHSLQSIRGTVTGDDALEVISDNEMRAYGWCYHLNGKDPGLLADQVTAKHSTDVIYWFFGFAHYKNGSWISYCTPTHIAKPVFVCRSR